MLRRWTCISFGALALAFNSGFSGCCLGGSPSNYYTFRWSYETHRSQIEWQNEAWIGGPGNPESIIVGVPDGSLPSATLIEVYRDDSRVEIPSEMHVEQNDARLGYECGATWIEFDLSALSGGEYLVVHRRSSELETADSREDWARFDGEPALVTPFVIDPRRIRDAGPDT